MSQDDASSVNVIAVSFEGDSSAYEALTNLKQLDAQGQIGLSGAAVVEREDDGSVTVKDQVAGHVGRATTTGGLVGLLVGILGGPFGILIGGATGLLIGSLFDQDDVEDTQSVLSEISKSLRPGPAALIAEVTEQSPEVVDAAMAKLSGTVLRRSAGDVEAEVAAAEHAQKEAKATARKELIHARRENRLEHVRAKIAELMAKLHRHRDEPAESA